jgi:LemA protein
MTPCNVFILAIVVFGILVVFSIILMVKAFGVLSRMRNSYKNSFVPVHVQLVKRRKMIESLMQSGMGDRDANDLEPLVEALKRACNAADRAQGRANSGNPNGHIARRLAPMEDAMVYAWCRLLDSFQNSGDPRDSEWAEKLQQPLVEIQERIESALAQFNSSLDDFNKVRSAFPFVLVAGLLGFKRVEPLRLKKACR